MDTLSDDRAADRCRGYHVTLSAVENPDSGGFIIRM
jgi:hypothetical protein